MEHLLFLKLQAFKVLVVVFFSSCHSAGSIVEIKKMMEVDFVDHFDTALNRSLKLLNDQRDCDLYFIVGQGREKFGAHKQVLKERSAYFSSKYSERWSARSSPNGDSNDNAIVLEENYEPEAFRSFLENIYGDVFNASPVEAVQLVSLALFYGVPSLIKPCEELLAKPFKLEHVLQVFVEARKYSMWNVMTKAGDNMANFFDLLINSPTFENVDEATLLYLLERDDLRVDEIKLFIFLVGWADKQIQSSAHDGTVPKPGRKEILKNLLPHVRFPIMNPQFAKDIALTNALPSEHECSLLYYFLLREEDDESGARAIASRLPYSAVPRQNPMLNIDFYKEKSRPGKGIDPNVALEKPSNVQDLLTVHGFGLPSKMLKIVSLGLEPPMFLNPLFELLQNSLEVAEVNQVQEL